MKRLWLVVATGLVACGGTAIIDPPGGSSSSSSSSSGAGGTTTTTTGVGASTSGTGAGDPGGPCGDICAHAAANGCNQVNCASSCDTALSDDGPCSSELAILVDCWAENLEPGVCAPPAICGKDHLAYLACSGTTFDFNGCPDVSAESQLPTGGCSSIACDFEGVVYVESCFCDGEGEFANCTCECIQDGALVGTCEEDATEGCYPLAACCEFVFFD